MNAAVIGVRGGACAKSRLAALLSATAREALVHCMLEAMLYALLGKDLRRYVVSPTPALLALARAYGATAIEENASTGLNDAFDLGCAAARADGADAVACLPGDLPLLEAAALDVVFAAAPARGAAIVRSADDNGTGALVLRKGAALKPRFGADSFLRHRESACDSGVTLVEAIAPSLAADIDAPAHLAALALRLREARLPRHLMPRLQALSAIAFHEAA